jgi:hypothetical protein
MKKPGQSEIKLLDIGSCCPDRCEHMRGLRSDPDVFNGRDDEANVIIERSVPVKEEEIRQILPPLHVLPFPL